MKTVLPKALGKLFDNYRLSHCNPYCCSDSEALACLHGPPLHHVNDSLHYYLPFFQSLTHFSSSNCRDVFLKDKQNSCWAGLERQLWLGEVGVLGLEIFTYTGLLTFFPHVWDIGKLAFFLFLPFPDPAIQQAEEWLDHSFLALILLLRKGAGKQRAIFL